MASWSMLQRSEAPAKSMLKLDSHPIEICEDQDINTTLLLLLYHFQPRTILCIHAQALCILRGKLIGYKDQSRSTDSRNFLALGVIAHNSQSLIHRQQLNMSSAPADAYGEAISPPLYARIVP